MKSGSIKLVLASGSPRRKELFARFWGEDGFEVKVPAFDEIKAVADFKSQQKTLGNSINPAGLVNFLTAGKLNSAIEQFDLRDPFVAVAADTIVTIDNKILGKPVDASEAKAMLKRLSGKKHQVITGVAVAISYADKRTIIQDKVITDVLFDRLEDNIIDWYVSTGEPMDKAGAYGIQGYGDKVRILGVN